MRAPRAMPVRRGIRPSQTAAAPPSEHAVGLARPRAGARRFFLAAGTAFLGVAVFLAVLGPCLCPPHAEGDGHRGCPSKPGFNAAGMKEACCGGPATPQALVEVTGQVHLAFAAIPAPTTFADDHAFLSGLSRPAGPHPARGAFPPLLNLRI
jgi:hypothetical protein